jgi:transcriptional regulator GlxA family with amidase domain
MTRLSPPAARTQRRVVLVAYPGIQTLDLVGPVEVFHTANRMVPGAGTEAPAYRTEVVTRTGEPVRSTSGLTLATDSAIADCTGPIDTLMVVGGDGTADAARDLELVGWIAAASTRARRTTSVCSGAFLLARAGLLDGKRATTHWSSCGLLDRINPSTTVERDPIFVRDGNVWTSAGITAGMDLALALVEDDHGADVARQVARWLVLFVQRPGGQSQFSAQLSAQQPERPALRELDAWIADHLDEDLSVPALARRVDMSTRNFARTFRQEVGRTPAAHVEAMRTEAARRLLETTDRSVTDIAATCGFGTVETLHRAFNRQVGTTPGAYRRRFTTTGVALAASA